MSSQNTPFNAAAANQKPFSFSTKNNTTGNRRPSWQLATIGGVASLAVIALVLYVIRPSVQGLDLIVMDVPPGSDIYVDNVKRGIPTMDGNVRVPNLKPGNHQVRCSALAADNQPFELNPQNQEHKCAQPTVVKLPPQISYGGSEMVLVEGGLFPMGENPSRIVDVPAFYIDKYEVTNGQFKLFCAPLNACPKYADDREYFDRDIQSPVIAISYEEAAAYAASVNKFLPTNEQWEKAASWGPGWEVGKQKKLRFPWGDAQILGVNFAKSGPIPFPVLPASTDVSQYGVVDMAGNAPEWVGATREERLTRGGNWTESLSDFAITRVSLAPDRDPDYASTPKTSWVNTFRCTVPVSDFKLQAFLREKGYVK